MVYRAQFPLKSSHLFIFSILFLILTTLSCASKKEIETLKKQNAEYLSQVQNRELDRDFTKKELQKNKESKAKELKDLEKFIKEKRSEGLKKIRELEGVIQKTDIASRKTSEDIYQLISDFRVKIRASQKDKGKESDKIKLAVKIVKLNENSIVNNDFLTDFTNRLENLIYKISSKYEIYPVEGDSAGIDYLVKGSVSNMKELIDIEVFDKKNDRKVFSGTLDKNMPEFDSLTSEILITSDSGVTEDEIFIRNLSGEKSQEKKIISPKIIILPLGEYELIVKYDGKKEKKRMIIDKPFQMERIFLQYKDSSENGVIQAAPDGSLLILDKL